MRLPACLFALLTAQAGVSYQIQTAAGTDSTGDGGYAVAAILSQAEGVALDARGNIYFADAGDNRVRRITPGGIIQTIAGTGAEGYAGDGGPANRAQLSHPYGIAVSAAGDLYVADLGNARVRRVSAGGAISTIAGGGANAPRDGALATDVKLAAPRNVALDSSGNLYVSDFGAHQVYRVSPAGALTAFAGTGRSGYAGEGGAATAATLNAPAGLAVDPGGAVYIADSGNGRVRKVARGVISSAALVNAPTGVALGAGGALYIAGGDYLGTPLARLGSSARDVAADGSGNIYFTTGPLLERVAAKGQLSVVAGTGAARFYGGDGGLATAARLHSPAGLARDASGNWYVADTANHRVRKIAASGVITTLAGTGEAGAGGDGGPAAAAQLRSPRGLAFDSAHNLYIADSGNHRIRKIGPDGVISTIADQLNDPESLAIAAAGSLYIADTGNNRVLELTAVGDVRIAATAQTPAAIAFDASGTLFIAGAARVAKLTASGVLATVAAGLQNPGGIAFDRDGALLIAESGANRIRRLTAAGVLSDVAGSGAPGFAGDGGPAELAELNAPAGLAVDGDGAVWIADSGNNRIRKLTGAAIADALAPLAVVNAATLAAGPIAPGGIVTIYGVGFIAGQTEVSFDGEPAALFYTGPNQINALAPADLKPGSTAGVAVAVNGAPLSGGTAAITASAPGLFALAGGSGPAAALNEDGTLNSAGNAAARGSIVSLYATGAGANPAAFAVKIGGYAAELLYAGPAPGFPGLLQINARVPAGFAPAGTLPVLLTVDGAATQAGVTLAVR